MAKMSAGMIKSNPQKLLDGLMEEMSSFTPEERKAQIAEINNDPVRMAILPKLLGAGDMTAAFSDGYDAGFKNDFANFLVRIPHEEVNIPVRIVHGTKDGDIPPTQAQQAADLLPNCELNLIENGWHIINFHPTYANEIFPANVEFFRKHLGQ